MGRVHDSRLDGVRGLSVIAVMLYHIGLLPYGAAGVDVFFVLSGFLITGILADQVEATGRIDLKAFYARRATRLLPALALLLVVYGALSPVLWPWAARSRWFDIAAAALQFSNWREALLTSEGPLAHTWSLSAEWQFYLVWPFAIAALLPLGRARAALAVAMLWAVTTALRLMLIAGGHDAFAYYAAPFHSSGLLLGGLLALWPPPQRRWTGWAALVGLAALAFVSNTHGTFWWRLTAIELAAAGLILAPPAWLAWWPLSRLGVISYGVYLWHAPVMRTLWVLPEWSRPPAMFAISIALAGASYFLIERPLSRLRAKTPLRVTQAAPTASTQSV
jgi:peptidoglycan/LPS O-acetylase OafA/YrhL